MKIHVLQEHLLRALSKTGKIVSAKTQLPILQNALLSVEDNFLYITTTNMETTIRCKVGVKVEKAGGLCVSSKLFADLVSSLPQETVSLEEKDGSLLVQTTRTKAEIPGIAASEFPPLVLAHTKKGKDIDKEVFLSALSFVLFAAAADDGRPLLTGVKIVKKEEELVFAATDGYRLSVKKVLFSGMDSVDMVVPARALAELHRMIVEEKDKEKTSVTMEKTEDGQIVFMLGDTVVTTRLIDGEYPAFEKIIPTSHTTRTVFDTRELAQAVKSAAIFARDNANIVKLVINKDGAELSANTPQVGQNTVSVDAKTQGDGGEIAFNSRFLIDFFGNYTEEELVFEMTGSLNPGVFRSAKDPSLLHIIMPVRVQA